MLIYPNIDPVAIALGPITVHWYGIMYLLAFAMAYGLALMRARKHGGWTDEMVGDIIFYGAMGVILGGRIGYVLFYQFDRFLAEPLWLFKVWEGGMSFHGGFLGVLIALALFAHHYQKTPWQTIDLIAPCVPTGIMFGRFGNFIGGELWGRPVSDPNYPFAMIFQHVDQIPRHPSQLYQAFGEGLMLFIVLWWFSSKPRPRMAVSAVFLMGYGVARFVVEFFRQPDADQGFILFGWMTKGQILTVPMLLVGLWMLWYAYRRNIYDWPAPPVVGKKI